MPIIRGFFFDLDGTLVNTYEADYLAYRDAIEEVAGKRVEREDFARTHGKEMRKKLDELVPGLSEEDIQRVAAGKKKHYAKYVHLTTPNEALVAFLAANTEHHNMVLVTVAKRQNAELVLETHGIKQYFSDMVFGDEVENPKPHPEAYLKALEKTGLKPEEVIVFEDSATGIAAAEAAGLTVVHVRNFA